MELAIENVVRVVYFSGPATAAGCISGVEHIPPEKSA